MQKPLYLYIVPFFPAPNYWRGGYFYDAVKSLQTDGRYDVRVLSTSELGRDYYFEGIHVTNFFRKFYGNSQYFETLLEGDNDRRLGKALKNAGIDMKDVAVCHIHDHNHFVHYANFVKKRNPKCLTLVHHHYSGWYDIEFGRLHNVPVLTDMRYLHLRRQYNQIDAHIFISEESRNRFGVTRSQDSCGDYTELRKTLAFGPLLPKLRYNDSYVWYNGVNTDVFSPANETRQSGHVIGCVGNFNPGKAQLDLIQAFVDIKKHYSDARLKLVGSGQLLQSCIDYVQTNNLTDSVEFFGEMPHSKMADYYRSLDLFVMPSINEGFCCVNIEANACGIPVIACEGMPFEELLAEEDKKKWLVPKHNPEAIARQVIRLFEKPEPQVLTMNLNSNYLANQFLDWVDEKRKGL